MKSLRLAARSLGVGKALRIFYHKPIGLLRNSIHEGGPFEQRRTAQGHTAMIAAASSLPPLNLPSEGPRAEIAFLSGPKYWHQTVFCFSSLQLHCPFKITPIVFSDGGLTERTKEQFLRVIPWAQFVDTIKIDEQLNSILPVHAFPFLRNRRQEYPHLRKLIDIHLSVGRPVLVLDSDMLFFQRPDIILDWFTKPFPVYMQDVRTSYGYPTGFLHELVGHAVPERVNVGLYSLGSTQIDWQRLEFWCREQIEVCGTHYLQEQALVAMLFAGIGAVALAREDYVVMPNLDEGRSPTAVLHHYVSSSKRSYFQHGWRRIAAMADAAQGEGCVARDSI
jgi:hypothetical protein